MGRKKSFDRDKVLQKARETFWKNGYEATSMKELSTEMGINPFSIYEAFDSKEALFCEALKDYHKTNYLYAEQLFGMQDISPADKFVRLFQMLRQAIVQDKQRKGCMMVNSIAELSGRLPEADKVIQLNERKYVQLFTQAIREGQENGTFNTSIPAEQLAAYVFSSFQGMRIFGKTNQDEELLAGIARQVVASLKK